MIRTKLLTTAALCALTSAAQAQDTPEFLGTIILSGGFTPIETNAYGGSATVVTAEEIETRGIATVQDVLRALPGVSVSSAGSSFTQVRMRGAEANHTLILINGIEAAGGDGEYNLSGLETATIERIEVLRGPQSVFYGSNASAGVINIITRRGGPGRSARLLIEGGNGTRATASVSTRTDRGGIMLSYSDTREDGWDFSGDDGETDGYDRKTLLVVGDYMVTPNLELGFTLRRASETYYSDTTNFAATTAEDYVVDDTAPYSDVDELTFGLYAELSLMDGRLIQRLSVERTENDQGFDGFDGTTTTTEAVKYRLTYGLDGQPADIARQSLTLLLEHEEDSSSINADFSRESQSIALEYRGSYDNGLDVQLGLRRDFNDPFEDATTWNLGLSYTLAGGVRLHASAGTGIVNPGYYELYDSFGYTGNPDLEPERNKSFDIGVEVPVLAGRGVVDLTYFNETLTDEITFVFDPADFSGTYVNQTGESTRRGVELTARIEATDTLDLRASYTYLKAENPDGSVEIRRPEQELSLGATITTPDERASVDFDLRYVTGNSDTQFFGSFQTIELPEVVTVDVAARYAITDAVSLTGRVENVFDDANVDTVGYAGKPRTIYVGLDASF